MPLNPKDERDFSPIYADAYKTRQSILLDQGFRRELNEIGWTNEITYDTYCTNNAEKTICSINSDDGERTVSIYAIDESVRFVHPDGQMYADSDYYHVKVVTGFHVNCYLCDQPRGIIDLLSILPRSNAAVEQPC